MRYRELFKHLETRFATAGVNSPAVDAELLIEECAGISRTEFLFNGNSETDAGTEKKILSLALRREAHEPLQYLLGKAWFMDLELEVTPAVLIPRPETELLVEWVVSHLPQNGRLLDLGTGSGAIALSAASMRPDAEITAADISPEALAVAERNRNACGLKHLRLLKSDLFSALADERFDIVAANLPYVTDAEYETLSPEVHDFEPRLALTAPEEGFALIRRTVMELPQHLTPGGGAIFELSPHQASKLAGLLTENGFSNVKTIRDLTGRERFVAGFLVN